MAAKLTYTADERKAMRAALRGAKKRLAKSYEDVATFSKHRCVCSAVASGLGWPSSDTRARAVEDMVREFISDRLEYRMAEAWLVAGGYISYIPSFDRYADCNLVTQIQQWRHAWVDHMIKELK